MPSRSRSNLGRSTRNARWQRNARSKLTAEQRKERNEIARNRVTQKRAARTQEERENANKENMHRMRHYRSLKSKHATMNLNNRARTQTNVAVKTYGAPFRHNVIDYSADQSVAIGSMNVLCPHCQALKYRNETPGLCCASGEVKLVSLVPPPQPGRFSGTGTDSTHCLTQIQKRNSCFQMTSFGTTNVVRGSFMPTFQVGKFLRMPSLIYSREIPKNLNLMVYGCMECPYITKLWFLFHNHLQRHEHTKGLELFECYKNTPEKFVCEECNFDTHSIITFKNHFKSHRYLSNVTTTHSGNGEAPVDHKVSNVVAIDGTGYFRCDKCSFKAKRKSVLRSHIGKHTVFEEMVWFKCFQCSYKAKRQCDLNAHIKRKHTPTENIKWFQCDKCLYKCPFKHSLKVHKLSKHTNPSDINWFHCKECLFKTKQRSNLNSHINRQHNIKWFQCNKCLYKCKGKIFLDRHALYKHKDSDDIKWFFCNECFFKTERKNDLKSHINRNHNIKWLYCDKCSYKSKEKRHLKRHVTLKHKDSNDMNLFHCSECLYKTLYKSDLETHINRKHTPVEDIKWFQCDKCVYKCKAKRDLNSHEKYKHGF